MMDNKMTIVQVPVNDLIAADYNPRIWDEDARRHLTSSIQKFGLVDPIIVNSAPNRKNIVIGGHFRLDIAKELGYETVPVYYMDLPDIEKEKELNLRLNKNTGAWDFSMLADFSKGLLGTVGFGSTDIDKMFLNTEDEDDEFDPDEAYGSINKPKAELGDVYQLGNHRLMCGDSTKSDDVKILMGGGTSQYGIYRSALQCRI